LYSRASKIQLNPSSIVALIKPDRRLAFRIVKEHLQLSTLVAESNNEGGTLRQSIEMVELNGIEPMTSCLQSRRSPN
jgi:hypothetical protein